MIFASFPMTKSSPSSIIIIHILIIHAFIILTSPSAFPNFSSSAAAASIDDDQITLFHGDYSPPSPPPPSPSPLPPPLACKEDLNGTGSLNTSCELNYDLNFVDDIFIRGEGNLIILPGVKLSCPRLGCAITVNISGEFRLGLNSEIIAGSLYVVSNNASLFNGSVVNVTALAGDPPEHTSGRPEGAVGGGGGHGGRGASCVMDNKKLPSDVWGGDPYAWDSLARPCSYGSKGGTTSTEEDYGGEGGGKIWFEVESVLDAHGSLLADGGDGGVKGGGGSGGSVYIKSRYMTGSGRVSACGGNGFAGGGGGRVSVDIFSMHDDPVFFAHGGRSYGCPGNSGAAGTFYDTVPQRLTVSNHNLSTETDTLLMEFPYLPLWTNVYIKDNAKATAPLLWSRMQVRGQLSLSCGAVLSFGLPHYALSEFELLAEELLMSDSTIKIYGALRMSVKIHLMLNSKIIIDGDGDAIVATSLLEASNLLVLRGSSVIRSNANLGVHGQGSLNLSGPGDVIEAQHLVLSLFYTINVGSGSILRGPLDNATDENVMSRLYCEREGCPMELLYPPEDCGVNSSLVYTFQICRVEDVNIEGLIEGSVVHFHWVRTVSVKTSGAVSASGHGCVSGLGSGKILSNGVAGGGGHGGRGGYGYYNGSVVEGGITYGNADLPCELGSGSGNYSLPGATAGGGIIVMGSVEHALSSLFVDGSLRADGESFGEKIRKEDGTLVSAVGTGGGSGGTILLFLHMMVLTDSSTVSTVGGHGSLDGGGGGGGRIHFHWSDITVGDEYQPVASVEGTINIRGGTGKGLGYGGENGTLSGISCPKGLYGIFCQECPVGTFKNVTGSDKAHCRNCPSHELPYRATYVAVRGGVADTPCPYKCISERYRMPHCYTALEELIYTFGGPWLFGFILLSLLVLLGLVLSVARMKFVGGDELPGLVTARRGLQVDRSFPFLESLNEVLETNRIEESQSHVHRMFFMGSNTFSEPWHLPYSPPEQVIRIVYEDAFNRFVDEINGLAAYQWWEGSVYSIVSILAYPLAWSWLQWRRKKKIHTLREFVRSEYDHACLRSCRSRALYEGLKVAATSDLMLAYVDFFLGGDEKRDDLPPRLHQRFPLSLVFGGDGSYMAPFSLHSDNILTSLMSQSVPPTIWYRLVAGLNAQLRLVRLGHLKKTFQPVLSWLETHANPTLSAHGVRVDLSCFQPTSSGYCQFGLLVYVSEDEIVPSSVQGPDVSLLPEKQMRILGTHYKSISGQLVVSEPLMVHNRMLRANLYSKSLQMFKEKTTICYPFSFVLCNTKPVGHQDLVGLVISVLLLGDFSLVLLTLLQQYSSSLLDFLLVLSILPLGIILPFPAGLNALFSHGPKRSSGPGRVYALWNITSLINVVVAFICGIVHFNFQSSPSKKPPTFQSFNLSMDESGWWMLPCGLVLCKCIQARVIDYHVANLEIHDRTLYSNDPQDFWQS